MNIQEARKIIGNQPTYALRNMKKALESIPFLNTQEDDKRLEACKIILKARK